jgi:alkylhydroperoxidase family enzyme
VGRIPYFDKAPAELQELLKVRHPLNLYRMLPHATTVAPGFLKMGGAILRDSAIDPVLREIVILRVGFLSKASYETHQHKRVARNVGVTDAKIAALENDQPDSDAFTPLEKLVIRYADDGGQRQGVHGAVRRTAGATRSSPHGRTHPDHRLLHDGEPLP